MRKYILCAILCCLSMAAGAQRYLYWYDGDVGSAIGGEVTSGQMHVDADVSALPYGYHTLNYALLDSKDGSMTDVRFVPFFKCMSMSVSQYVYWFDNAIDEAIYAKTDAGIVHVDADYSKLAVGYHTLTFGIVGEDGSMTDVRFMPFFKTMATGASQYVYWFDNATDKAVFVKAASGVVHVDADYSELADGYHTLTFGVVGEDGSVTDLRFVSFVKLPSYAVGNLHLVYSIDEGESHLSDSPKAGKDIYTFQIDVASLSLGEHTISYMLTDGNYTYATGQATFTKTEVSGTGIVTFGKQTDSPFYNINGIKVERPVKGLYIRDGKEVIVK